MKKIQKLILENPKGFVVLALAYKIQNAKYKIQNTNTIRIASSLNGV